MNEPSLKLPRTVGAWTQSGGPQFVGPREIFNYMDGAGELYLGYHFKQLEVLRYGSADQGEILVELYWMGSSDDSYGLLSGDWGGDLIELQPSQSRLLVNNDAARGLYGAGLLRLWSDNLYARVMADHETEASKVAVQTLGRAIASGRSMPLGPALVRALPPRVGSHFSLRSDRVVFLRSHLVLNSVYFLSSENLLDLGPDCEVATSTYARDSAKTDASAKPTRLLLARYPDEAAAQKGLQHFRQIYLPEKSKGTRSSFVGDRGVVSIEDGWMGFARSGRGIVLVFESPDRVSAQLLLDDCERILENLEASRE